MANQHKNGAARAAGSHRFSPGGSGRAETTSGETPAAGLGLPAAAGTRSAKVQAVIAAVLAEPCRTLESIGVQFGVTRQHVRKIVARHNVPRQKQRPGRKALPDSAQFRAEKAAALALKAAKWNQASYDAGYAAGAAAVRAEIRVRLAEFRTSLVTDPLGSATLLGNASGKGSLG